MRIVLDSNVLVAAFATHGVCHEILEYCLRNCTILCSDFISQEVERTLTDKIKIPSKTASEVKEFLKNRAQWVVPAREIIEELRDPNDLMVLATAFAGKADYLISGDKDLLVLKEVRKVLIVSPKDFWIKCQVE